MKNAIESFAPTARRYRLLRRLSWVTFIPFMLLWAVCMLASGAHACWLGCRSGGLAIGFWLLGVAGVIAPGIGFKCCECEKSLHQADGNDAAEHEAGSRQEIVKELLGDDRQRC